MKHLKLAGWIFCIAFLQICFARFFSISGIAPNFLFAFTICYAALERDVFYSLVAGGCCGLLLDICASHAFGVHLLAFFYCVLLLQIAGFFVNKNHFLFAAAVAFILSFLSEAFYYLFVFQSLGISFRQAAGGIIVRTACYNMIVSLILYPLIKKTLSDQKHKLRRNRI